MQKQPPRFLILWGLSFLLLGSAAFSTDKPMAMVQAGGPAVKRSGMEDFVALAARDVLYVGDVVRTGPESKASLLFADGMQVRMNFNTTLEITPPTPVGQGAKSPFRLLLGNVWVRLRPGQAVQTPSATVRARREEENKPSPPNRIKPQVYPRHRSPFGQTYREWSVVWWQWALTRPKTETVADPTGEQWATTQSGPVWFLPGGLGTLEEYAGTVPEGKALLFPLLSSLGWVPTDGPTLEAIRAQAKKDLDQVTELEVTVDGVAIQSLRNFRFRSPEPFSFTGPADESGWLFPGQRGTYEAVAEGYWIMLKPLPVGHHTIRCRAKQVYPGIEGSEDFVFEVEVTYHLTVGNAIG